MPQDRSQSFCLPAAPIRQLSEGPGAAGDIQARDPGRIQPRLPTSKEDNQGCAPLPGKQMLWRMLSATRGPPPASLLQLPFICKISN